MPRDGRVGIGPIILVLPRLKTHKAQTIRR